MMNNFTADNVVSIKELARKVKSLKMAGLKIGFCQGTFDLVHPGHVAYLSEASKFCDCLIVAVSDDKVVGDRKGEGRPIIPANLSAYTLANLSFVCYVVVTPHKRATPLIKLLKPDFYIKGKDYVKQNTPGIVEERAAIKSVGGRMIYTSTPKLSTSAIIKHIQEKVRKEKLLLVLDRDGTLIELVPWLGQKEDWKSQVKLKKEVVDFIYYVQKKYDCTTIVATNQGGVARNVFTENRVKEINTHIHKLLKDANIKIDCWKYSPYADVSFALKHKEINWDSDYLMKESDRKPSIKMIQEAVLELNKTFNLPKKILVMGDSDDDRKLAKNLGAKYVDVNKGGKEKWMRHLED